ncbi:MAG: HAD family hydrolase [Candidatus Bathyarchaeia archaeon]|nr:HAD family hydrolase [Candidatus Bathyarchaeota archaeon]
MRVKAVIFDLDDTLIRSGIDYRVAKVSAIKFLVESGVDETLLNENMSNMEIINRAIEDLRKKNFSEIRIKEIINNVYAMFNKAELKSLDKAELMDTSLKTLTELKSLGLKIGIVTNSCSTYSKKIVEKFSLDKYIDILVSRDDVTRHKPDPEHLLKALEALGVDSSEAVFVGDHFVDALCAKRAGVKFILVKNKKWSSQEAEKNAFTIIDDLGVLSSLIRQL